ncbi:hypothetical protein SRIMHP_21350 [Streptomyces rimosus subsp. rimosus]|uniref:Uncharacterized protein n=1 Tax=Streptomyces rimosus subsp. rimosus TaxID=132474 RepID=A0ABY3Z4Y9_STRRM|nr:hypothetical protein SRIMR7_23985 [Streptomyces rimosus subsp. rimosus]UTH96676.1 hypothetical protein SRIMHP_21350 [Streptomyces rimosus subsp. rimosus]UTJ14774.1 hypothetical protein SRIMDV3_21245 [Streptomyces rimosus subsp. rimosus]
MGTGVCGPCGLCGPLCERVGFGGGVRRLPGLDGCCVWLLLCRRRAVSGPRRAWMRAVSGPRCARTRRAWLSPRPDACARFSPRPVARCVRSAPRPVLRCARFPLCPELLSARLSLWQGRACCLRVVPAAQSRLLRLGAYGSSGPTAPQVLRFFRAYGSSAAADPLPRLEPVPLSPARAAPPSRFLVLGCGSGPARRIPRLQPRLAVSAGPGAARRRTALSTFSSSAPSLSANARSRRAITRRASFRSCSPVSVSSRFARRP